MGQIPVSIIEEEYVLPQPALQAAVSAVKATAMVEPHDFTPAEDTPSTPHSPFRHVLNTAHHHSFPVFVVLFLAVGVAAILVGGKYWSDRTLSRVQPIAIAKPVKPTIAGLNLTVLASDAQAKIQSIAAQPATLTVGDQTIPIGADTIKSWLQVTTNKAKTENYIRVRSGTINASLTQLAGRFTKTPINQVTVTEDGVSRVVVGGRNGIALSDPSSLKTQADQVAKTVMNGTGMKFSTPLSTQPFQSVTPTAFSKLLVANVSAKKMWAFQDGQQVNSWLVSAGAPATPTNIGEFKIYAKYAVQDMRGTNPNGTPYFQPHVPWVNYFSGGDAVHGNYWRPASVYGAVNTSHGCVSVPVNQAAWIYNWAPIGTTVIVHA